MDINNDGTVDWEELSSFMIEMGMKGWAKSGAGIPNYAYAGHVDSARPTQAADQVTLSGTRVAMGFGVECQVVFSRGRASVSSPATN